MAQAPQIAASRFGSDLTGMDKSAIPLPVDQAAGEIGANTLVGVRSTDGLAEQYAPGNDYSQVAIAMREFGADGSRLREVEGDHLHRGVEIMRSLKLDVDVAGVTQEEYLGQTVYGVDEHTVSLNSDSNGDGTGTAYDEVGEVVEVRESEDMVYVYVGK